MVEIEHATEYYLAFDSRMKETTKVSNRLYKLQGEKLEIKSYKILFQKEFNQKVPLKFLKQGDDKMYHIRIGVNCKFHQRILEFYIFVILSYMYSCISR